MVLKGANLKAKANAAQAVGELIQIAENKSVSLDYNAKHGKRQNLVGIVMIPDWLCRFIMMMVR